MAESKNTMTSSRPYLVRAFNEWILDNDCTPYIVVDAGIQGVQVPTEHVANGQIVLNISPGAVRGLVIGNGALEFSARFGGVPMQVFIPLQPGSPDPDGTSKERDGEQASPGQEDRPSGRPTLKVVK